MSSSDKRRSPELPVEVPTASTSLALLVMGMLVVAAIRDYGRNREIFGAPG
jgi:hypothetical protein